MTTFGLTPEGFVLKTVDDIRADLAAAFRVAFGANIQVDRPISAMGQIVGVFSERFGDLWELGQAISSSLDPDAATGESQDEVCALTGTVREGATHSTVPATLTGTPLTSVPSGSVASVTGTGTRFATDEVATIIAAAAWQATHVYALGARVTNAARVYQCITAGTSAGSGGPTTTSADITDNTVHWRYLGQGTGVVDIGATAEATGPLAALSGTLSVIETPVAGWSSVVNVLDGELGSDVETDAALRIRREQELAPAAATAADAIRTRVLKVGEGTSNPVTSCTVYANDGDVADGDGIPPHTVMALVRGGVTQDILDAILATVAAGIGTYGTTSGTSIDSEGNAQAVAFQRPTLIDIYVDVTVTYDASLWPADGVQQVKDAIVAAGDAYPIGRNVTAWAQAAALAGVPGILDVPLATIFIDTTPAPASGATIPISKFELAVFDTSRVTVTANAGTP